MEVEIVEKKLFEKLNSKEGEGSEINNQTLLTNCKSFSFDKGWKDVEKVIKEKKPPRDAEIENLYHLLNVKADWVELEKKPHFLKKHAANELGGRVNKIKSELEKAAATKGGDHKEDPASAWFSTSPEIYRWSSQAVDLEKIKIHGFKEKSMVMERLLLKENNKVVWIVGVVGVGKTALCQLAISRKPVQNYFPLRIWLCFSKQNRVDASLVKKILNCLGFEDDEAIPEQLQPQAMAERILSCEDEAIQEQLQPQAMAKRILSCLEQLQLQAMAKRILSCLGFEDEAIPEKLQLQAMRRQLKRGRYLIVLDDVSTEDRNLISFLTQDPDQYGSLLVTSRYEYAEKMKIINTHTLLPLVDEHDDSCWNIFSDAVEKDGNVTLPQEMRKLKEKIVKKCEGLPLMAKMLGLIGQDLAKNIDLPQSDHGIQTQQQ